MLTRLPATVALPSFGEQMAMVFEIRVLQLAIERGVGNLLTGEVDESVRAAQPRIVLMRELACRLQELAANRTDFEYTSEIRA
ncbi:MAG: hypothetical protein ACLFSZ_10455 [Puniceicoccaceae bacterium]